MKEEDIVDHKAECQHGELELEVHVEEEGAWQEPQDAAVDVILEGEEARAGGRKWEVIRGGGTKGINKGPRTAGPALSQLDKLSPVTKGALSHNKK